ncbi:MAG: hypothetical protein ACC742_15920 [Thermoanaerobaculales bacterium]
MPSQLNRTFVLRFAAVLVTTAVASLTVHAGDLPDTPDGTVKAVFEGLADKRPEVLWNALPASYRNDIAEVTHAFAGKMDPELWDTTFALGMKIAGMLRDKKQFILESSFMNAAGDERVRIEGNWDTAVALLGDFFSSEISKLENLKTIDWEQFLKTTGTEIMGRAATISTAKSAEEPEEDLIAMLRQTTVETVSREGDTATVKVSAPGEDPEELSLTLVEGRWVPTDMADDWDKDVAEAMQKIAEISEEEMAKNKMQAMMMFGMADAMLDQLAAVSSTEEFEKAIQGILGSVMGMGGEGKQMTVD